MNSFHVTFSDYIYSKVIMTRTTRATHAAAAAAAAASRKPEDQESDGDGYSDDYCDSVVQMRASTGAASTNVRFAPEETRAQEGAAPDDEVLRGAHTAHPPQHSTPRGSSPP